MGGQALRHPLHPGDPNWVMLADFRTGHAEILRAHTDWLDAHAIPALLAGSWAFLRGRASHAWNPDFNMRLSKDRVDAVANYLIPRVGAQANRITRRDAVGETQSGPDPDAFGSHENNDPIWRSVEVVITRLRIIELPPIEIEGRIPRPRPAPSGRFRIAVQSSMSFLILSTTAFIIRDTRNHTEARFETHGFGVGGIGGNIGGRGRWFPIPDDPHLTSLDDFDGASVTLASMTGKPRRGGRPDVPSETVLNIRPSDRHARRITISRFDAGNSLIPETGLAVGDLGRQPLGDVSEGTFLP